VSLALPSSDHCMQFLIMLIVILKQWYKWYSKDKLEFIHTVSTDVQL